MAQCRGRLCVSWRLASEIVAGENRLGKLVTRFSQVAHGVAGENSFAL